MRPSDLLVLAAFLIPAAALAAFLGDGFASQAVLALTAGGGGVCVGTRIKNRRRGDSR
ncbi:MULTISPECIES: hypothetical protein [unclassified Streptomyces]|uniref:hypothetical protein n=1 Tax=unclassified Streptomyces TaxID=2593676 RepID=UPI0022385475|nr:hypothetical protein [Streptomyces sp. SHP 1-2]MCW5253628.1 hypothetical protein [Streptomyces sp. SHP 1-2]